MDMHVNAFDWSTMLWLQDAARNSTSGLSRGDRERPGGVEKSRGWERGLAIASHFLVDSVSFRAKLFHISCSNPIFARSNLEQVVLNYGGESKVSRESRIPHTTQGLSVQ